MIFTRRIAVFSLIAALVLPMGMLQPSEAWASEASAGVVQQQDAAAPAEAASAEAVALANPIVEYSSYDDVALKMGFAPLALLDYHDFNLQRKAIISKQVAELEYVKDHNKFIIRTARAKDVDVDNISGVYSTKWTWRSMGLATVFYTQYDNSYTAYWEWNGYEFSVRGEGIGHKEFIRILENELVNMSTLYFR